MELSCTICNIECQLLEFLFWHDSLGDCSPKCVFVVVFASLDTHKSQEVMKEIMSMPQWISCSTL